MAGDLTPLLAGDVPALRRLAVVLQRRRFSGAVLAGVIRRIAEDLEQQSGGSRRLGDDHPDPYGNGGP